MSSASCESRRTSVRRRARNGYAVTSSASRSNSMGTARAMSMRPPFVPTTREPAESLRGPEHSRGRLFDSGRRLSPRLWRRRRAPRHHEERVDAGDVRGRQLEPGRNAPLEAEQVRLPRAEQPVMKVATGRVAGLPLPADDLPRPNLVAALHREALEVRVDAPIAVAVVDDESERQDGPGVLLLEVRL